MPDAEKVVNDLKSLVSCREVGSCDSAALCEFGGRVVCSKIRNEGSD